MNTAPRNQTEREVIDSDSYSDLDKHDVAHDTYGNQSESSFWGKED
jgi:hypothetical protein